MDHKKCWRFEKLYDLGGGGPIFLEKIGEIYTKNDDAFMIFVTWYETKDVDGFINNNLFYSVAQCT